MPPHEKRDADKNVSRHELYKQRKLQKLLKRMKKAEMEKLLRRKAA